MLDELNVMVQKYLRALSNCGAVILRASVIAAATALLKKYTKNVTKIDLKSQKTSSKVEITDN